MNKRILFPIISIFVIFLLISTVKADGGFFPPVYYKEDIFEPTQKAVIFYNNNQERIILQASYSGSMKEFAWVIPVPGYPVVDKSDPLLFEELHFLTEPINRRAPEFPLFFGGRMAALTSEDVTLYEQYQVGIYEVSILSATDPNALINWLNNNAYSIPSYASGVIKHYIDKNWYFIAMRINLAPYNEKLISTLRKIDSKITTQENAVEYLTEDLVNYVKEGRLYDELTEIRETKIEYGEETQTKISANYPYSRRIYYETAPKVLIENRDYTNLYETYNGYLDGHLRNEIYNTIKTKLDQKIRIPDSYECYEGRYWNTGSNYSYCYVWYFTKDSEEYRLLKNVDCGSYCSKISPTKQQYSADDFAYVAANAILENDEEVKDYFNIYETKMEWYQNRQQRIDWIANQVKGKLISKLNTKRDSLRSSLEQNLAQEYSQKTGISFGSLDAVAYHFSDKTMQDIKGNKSFSESYIYTFGLLTYSEYANFKKLHDGDHDLINLRESMKEIVNKVVYFEYEQVKEQLNSGTVQPVIVTFTTDEIVYPLKMSSINKGVAEVLLYVFAKYRTEIEGFNVEYAKWIRPEDVRTKEYFEYKRMYGNKPISEVPSYYRREVFYNLNELLDDKYFLTKFRDKMYPSEMEDLVITQAANDKEYRLVVYEDGYVFKWIGFIIGMGIVASITGVLFLPIGWLNNRIIHEDKKSIFYATRKRCFYYGIILIILFSIAIVSATIANVYGEILKPFVGIFEFLSHLLNFIGFPEIIIAIIIFIIVLFLLFELIHVCVSLIMSAFEGSKKKEILE